MIQVIITMLAFAVANRARGSKFFGLTESTEFGRIIATFIMALAMGFVYYVPNYMKMDVSIMFSWPLLVLWATFGWDAYWSAEIGNDPVHSEGWGVKEMAFRMCWAIPSMVVYCWLSNHWEGLVYAAGIPLMALPYYLYGKLTKRWVIELSEPTNGLLMGYLYSMAAGGHL